MVYYEPSQPELYHGRNLDAAYHRFAHRHRVELVHAYDEAAVRARTAAASTARDFTRAAGLRRPRRRRGEPHRARAPSTARAAAGTSARARGSSPDAWMTFLARRRPEGHDVPLHARRALPAEFPHIRTLAENVHSNPGPGGRCPLFVTKQHRSRSSTGPSTSGASRRRPSTSRAAEAERREGTRVLVLQRRPAQGPGARDRRARHRGARHGLGRVQARRRRLLLLARRALAAQPAEAGRAQAERLGEPDHVRQPRPAQQALEDQGYINGDGVLLYPGEEKIHPEEDRGIAGPVRHACSSRTCGAACRTTCT